MVLVDNAIHTVALALKVLGLVQSEQTSNNITETLT